MAERPVFVPQFNGPPFVLEKSVQFTWFPGFSLEQKRRSIESLHSSAKGQYDLSPLLEISSKSPELVGINLSAFNLQLKIPALGQPISVEAAFQGSKVFDKGGPFTDLYQRPAREAKKDLRLRESGQLRHFQFNDERWMLKPKTAFYDWLYLLALGQHPDLAKKLLAFKGFTDIEFNPRRSFNCQARSAALYVSLTKCGLLEEAMGSKEAFLGLLPDSDGQDVVQTKFSFDS